MQMPQAEILHILLLPRIRIIVWSGSGSLYSLLGADPEPQTFPVPLNCNCTVAIITTIKIILVKLILNIALTRIILITVSCIS